MNRAATVQCTLVPAAFRSSHVALFTEMETPGSLLPVARCTLPRATFDLALHEALVSCLFKLDQEERIIFVFGPSP